MVKAKLVAGVVAVGLLAAAVFGESVARGVTEQQDTPTATASGTATASSSAAQVDYDPAPIDWGRCEDSTLRAFGAECGFLTVPLDYTAPDDDTIRLAVSRVTHSVPDSDYQGVMLVNPGGPGGSGLSLSSLGQYVPDAVGQTYDWIGFDPRGVGSSEPSLTCDGSYFDYDRPDYVPDSDQDEQVWLNRAQEYAQDCEQAGGDLLDHVKTTDTVQDMDVLRKALGQEQISYYGFSYGTYLGQVYATMYPARVNRMVMDGVVDPRGVWYEANLDQDVAFDASMDVFFDWVATYDDVYDLGATAKAVKKEYYRQLKALERKAAGGRIGGDEWTDLFLAAGYYVYGWEDIASAFSGWVHDGDWKALQDLYDEANPQGAGEDNGYAMYLATECTDVQWPTDWQTWDEDNTEVDAQAPFETWANAWYNAPCLYWEGEAGTPVTVDGSQAPPILLISETYDAATPFEGALEVRSRFPGAVLIEGVDGTTHAGSLNGVSCTDQTIAAYLADGTLPDRLDGRTSDVQCDPVAQPVPAGGAAAQPQQSQPQQSQPQQSEPDSAPTGSDPVASTATAA